MTSTTLASHLPPDRLERLIEDFKPALSPAQAKTEAHRCLYCHDAPCVQACPTAINIPEFIRQLANDNPVGAAKTILSANILGHSCARVCPVDVLCAGSCVYHGKGESPIAIGRLQRHATEYAYERGLHFFEKGPKSGKRVALVGAGPASLACAHELVRLGHEAVVFEGRSLPGGLNTTGIAPYKIQAEEALREVDYIRHIGFEIRTETLVGRDVSFAQLESDFDAVFLGMGLGPDSTLGLTGETLDGCMGAVALIEAIKCQSGFSLSGVKAAVVIGGGNTAIDVVRELLALGVEDVTMVYRRTEAQMSGYAHELAWAKQEGVKMCFLAAPVSVEGTERVRGLKCRAMTAELEAVPGSEFVLKADLVVKATGQEKLTGLLASIPHLRVEKGRVVVNGETHQTSNSKFFAGGDCANGGKEVVNAAAEGKAAAQGIHAHLTGGRVPSQIQVTIQ